MTLVYMKSLIDSDNINYKQSYGIDPDDINYNTDIYLTEIEDRCYVYQYYVPVLMYI